MPQEGGGYWNDFILIDNVDDSFADAEISSTKRTYWSGSISNGFIYIGRARFIFRPLATISKQSIANVMVHKKMAGSNKMSC
jgi:hypothetical protein